MADEYPGPAESSRLGFNERVLSALLQPGVLIARSG